MKNVAPWAALYPTGVGSESVNAPVTMLSAWREAVDNWAELPAVQFFGETLTFSELDQASSALAGTLADLGVQPGDRVAIYLQNDPQWVVTMLAAWKLRATAVCVNPMLREKELRHLLADSRSKVLVCLDHLYEQVVAPLRDDLSVEIVITTHPWDMARGEVVPESFSDAWGQRRRFADTTDWLDAVRRIADEAPRVVANVDPGDVALLTYTSGTTGRAKGAMNLHRNVAHSAAVFAEWFDLGPEDSILGIAPLFHITGSVAGLALSIVSGAPVVLLHRFDAALTLAAIERYRTTFTVAASTAFNALASHPDAASRDLSSLTKAASGGAPLSPALVGRVTERTGWRLHGVYGLTETTSPTTICPFADAVPVDVTSGALSVGIPVPGANVVIVDVESGEPVPAGTTGEITVAGPMVVPGYWDAPEETAHALREGRLFTGDVGIMDEQGWVYVVDRKKDLINAGGYKIWPREVEDVLGGHPAVREAAVVGVPDEYRGETVRAVVSLRDGVAATPQELIAFCKQRMAAYKYPREVLIVDDLPKNASGKVLRRELRPGVATPTGAGRGA